MSAHDIDSASATDGASIIPIHPERNRDDASSSDSRPSPSDEGMAALSRLLDEAWVF